MIKNKVYRIYENGLYTIDDMNKELLKGWTVQTVLPVANGTVDYVLAKEIADEDKKEDAERMSIRSQLNAALEELEKECRRKHFIWRFIKEAYERSKAKDNKWWANASCYFNVSKFPEIFEAYDANGAAEIIKKYYAEEDKNDKEQSSEN
jgi:uncharacterized protein with ParB-like and HNH nuclease domain